MSLGLIEDIFDDGLNLIVGELRAAARRHGSDARDCRRNQDADTFRQAWFPGLCIPNFRRIRGSGRMTGKAGALVELVG